ncbi:MAG: C40 family peptidase [Actinobacteria bacterium]|nr:C40 family peptidase [Actinomycetota bacterium]
MARKNLRRSEAALSNRLVAMYTGEETSTLGVLLGATSFDDLLSRMDAVDRVADQDVDVHRETVKFRVQVRRQRTRLRHARAEQARVVEERAAHRASVEQQLAERRSLVASIRGEIARLQAEERARQQAAARAAERRLAAAQAAAPVLPTPLNTAVESDDGSDESSAVSAAPAPTASAPARYGGVVGIAMRYLGVPYKWGGASPSTGFDCSGFIMYVYSQVGVSLPHNAAAQYGVGTPVSRSQLQPGDLVFFNGLGHNGIYIGGGQFIHSPHTGDVVKISSLSDSWYAATWVGARRV